MRWKRISFLLLSHATFLVISRNVHEAIEAENVSEVTACVKKRNFWQKLVYTTTDDDGDDDVDLEQKDEQGRSPLMRASEVGHEEIVKILLDANADPKAVDNDGNTCLHYAAAASNANASIVRLLLRKGAEADAANVSDDTALQYAVRRGDDDVIVALVEGNADIKRRDRRSNTLLHYYAASGVGESRKIVELLTSDPEAGMEVLNESMETPLMTASLRGSENTVIAFIEAGADLRVKSEDGDTLLHVAVNRNFENVARCLIRRRFPLEKRNRSHETAAYSAVRRGNYAMIALLLRAGADVNARNYESDTLVHRAVYDGADSILELLTFMGADVNAMNGRARTPLSVIHVDNKRMRLQLIESGCSIPFPHRTLARLSPAAYRIHKSLKKSSPVNYDDFLATTLEAYLKESSSSELSFSKTETSNLRDLILRYQNFGMFGFYRILTLLYSQLGKKGATALESVKFDISDGVLNAVIEGTYAESLPIEIASDAFHSVASYYWWKIERFSWNAALAAHHLNAEVDEIRPELTNAFVENHFECEPLLEMLLRTDALL